MLDNKQVNDNLQLWLFRNHLNEFRYIISEFAPKKLYVYDKEYDHTEEVEKYHGSFSFTVDFYHYSDYKIYYWGLTEKPRYTSGCTSDVSYFVPEIIGTLVPEELISEKYKDLSFEDEPISITHSQNITK